MAKRTRSDADNPEVTDEQFARMRSVSEVWPNELVEEFRAQQRRRVRGPQKAPRKVAIAIRLPPDVVHAYKSVGRGWQVRMGEDLAKAAKRLRKKSA